MNDDIHLRVYCLEQARQIEGPKALTEDVLECAWRIYEFLKDLAPGPNAKLDS
jgi:hypothetical protein